MCHQHFGRTCFFIFRMEELTEDGDSSFLQKVRKFSLFSKASLSWRRLHTGRFIMFSVVTNIYNKKTKGPILMKLFTAAGKLKVFFTTRDVRCVHHGWHGTHRYDIQVVATYASACVARTWISYRTVLSPTQHSHTPQVQNMLQNTDQTHNKHMWTIICNFK
jgi:hypothetical protein